MSRVKISVYCGSDGWGCGALIGTFYDKIEEKWDFYCNECDFSLCAHGAGKNAWRLETEVINDENPDA